MKEYFDLLSRIVIWGGILFILLFFLLKQFRIIASPNLLENLIIFILGWLIRLEVELKIGFKEIDSKLNLIWSDFKKRKKIII